MFPDPISRRLGGLRREAATGREAVEKTEKLKRDIVILDIAMPELNGLEAARLIAFPLL